MIHKDIATVYISYVEVTQTNSPVAVPAPVVI